MNTDQTTESALKCPPVGTTGTTHDGIRCRVVKSAGDHYRELALADGTYRKLDTDWTPGTWPEENPMPQPAAHTPAPWSIGQICHCDTVQDGSLAVFANPEHRQPGTKKPAAVICVIAPPSFTTPEDQSNAHLIAAAPDLLTALTALLARTDAHFGGPDKTHDWQEQEQARAAIARATGHSTDTPLQAAARSAFTAAGRPYYRDTAEKQASQSPDPQPGRGPVVQDARPDFPHASGGPWIKGITPDGKRCWS